MDEDEEDAVRTSIQKGSNINQTLIDDKYDLSADQVKKQSTDMSIRFLKKGGLTLSQIMG